jgi:hypothetical protein
MRFAAFVLALAAGNAAVSAMPLESNSTVTFEPGTTDTIQNRECGGVTTSEGRFPLYGYGGCRQFANAIRRFHIDRNIYCYFYPYSSTGVPCTNQPLWRGRGPIADRDFIWGNVRLYRCASNP